MAIKMIPKEKQSVVGTRPARFDAQSKVTGHALYGTDINLPGIAAWSGAAQPPRPRPHPVNRHQQS